MNLKRFSSAFLSFSCASNLFATATTATKKWGHYSSIGIHVETFGGPSEDEAQQMQNFWVSLLKDIRTELIDLNGQRVFYTATESGANLWCAVTPDNEVLGFEPHFSGSSCVSVRSVYAHEDWSGLEAWLEGETSGTYLEFNCPNYALHKEYLSSNVTVRVEIAAFATQLVTFDSVVQFDDGITEERVAEGRAQKKKKPTPPKSFVHAGFVGKGKPCHAMFTGHVVDAEKKINEITGAVFYWALVSTSIGDIDVVMDPNCLEAHGSNPPRCHPGSFLVVWSYRDGGGVSYRY